MKICKSCIKNERTPGIYFVGDICNYCLDLEKMNKMYPISDKILKQKFDAIKKENKDAEYDCVLGVSGGCDSSILMDVLHKHDVRTLGVHWDNNWNSVTAEKNMECIAKQLDIPIERYGCPREEYDDICRSFLWASVIDMDIPNDIALAQVLYVSAFKHGIKTIINGHSFRTEGFTPAGWTWMDGGYIIDVHNKFGKVKMSRYPNLTVEAQDQYIDAKIKRFRPLYHMLYLKEEARKYLHDTYGWEWYGGHHAENIYTKFIGNYMLPRKFGVDFRYVEYSALVMDGQMSREDAWRMVHNPSDVNVGMVDEVKKRLNLSGEEFEKILSMPIKTYRDYDNYLMEFKKRLPKYWKAVDEGVLPFTFVNRVENEPEVEK